MEEQEKHGCFISYKKEDKHHLEKITECLEKNAIAFSYLDDPIESDNIDTVIAVLRKEYMNNKPVTLFLIGEYSYEDTKERWAREYPYKLHGEYNEQSFIIRELRATLSDYEGSPRHGIVGIVLPEMVSRIYSGGEKCQHCGCSVRYVNLNDNTVIREFHENYYLIKDSDKCSHYSYDGQYCVLCTLDNFLNNPCYYINEAYKKSKSNLADSVHYKNIKHDFKLRDE